jgi:hypothetical protein
LSGVPPAPPAGAPPSAPTLLPPAGVSTGAAAGPVVGPIPPALAALPPAQRIAAHVEALLANGGVRLSTPHGPITVAVDPPPARGTAVTLLLQRSADGPMARLLSPMPGGHGAASAPHGVGAAGAASRPVTATLLTPMSWAGAAAPSGAGSAVAGAAPGGHTLPAGTRLVVRWSDGAPSPAGATGLRPATPLTPGSRHAGEMIGTVGGNRTMVRMAGGVIAVEGAPPPAARTPIVEIVRLASVPLETFAAGRMTSAPTGGPDGPASRWPALSEAAGLIAAAERQRGGSALRGDVPRPDRDLAAALLRFLTALGGGNGADWPSPAGQRLLDRRAPGLLPRVGEEMREAARLFDPPSVADWRSATLPFVTPEGTRMLRFSRRGGRKGETADGKPTGTRFVVDVRLSRLGRVQLDGLVPAESRRFELMVRTETPLPAEVRDGIRAVFAEATAIGGLGGALGFQASPATFVEVDVREPAESGGIFA